MRLHRNTIIDLMELIEKFPDADFITLTEDSSSGIGSCQYAEIPVVVNEVKGSMKIQLTDESTW